MIQRLLNAQIEKKLFKGKIILLFGPRQSGKTTLVKQIMHNYKDKPKFWSGDNAGTKQIFSEPDVEKIKQYVANSKLIIIDEAQQIQHIGTVLKIIADNFCDVQIIATGSSAFELYDSTAEALTGRKYEYYLYPISWLEMQNHTDFDTENRNLEQRLIYGYYPEIVTHEGEEQELLSLLSGSILYKDIFASGQIKKPAILEKLLIAIALQIGQEVSYRELGTITGANNETIERYIDLLEKSFIIYRLSSLSRNLRNELKNSRKICFYDNGIRNAIIKNFNPLSMRQDVGALWENFLITERLKANHYSKRFVNKWFWRTHSQQEIDYIEERNGNIFAYEFKWKEKKYQVPKSFKEAYPQSVIKLITKRNYKDFIEDN